MANPPKDQPPQGTKPRQLAFDFWGDPLPFALETDLRTALTDAIKESGLSNEQVADLLTVQLKRRVSSGRLYSWRAQSKDEYRLPADAIVALSRVLRTDRFIQILAGALGGRVLFGADLERAELAALEDERGRLAREIGRRKRVAEARGLPVPGTQTGVGGGR